MLQGVFLSAVTFLFALVMSFASSERSAFTSLIEGYSMNAVSFTFGTVRIDFFRNVHVVHYQLCIKETYSLLYLFTFTTKTNNLLEESLRQLSCSKSNKKCCQKLKSFKPLNIAGKYPFTRTLQPHKNQRLNLLTQSVMFSILPEWILRGIEGYVQA